MAFQALYLTACRGLAVCTSVPRFNRKWLAAGCIVVCAIGMLLSPRGMAAGSRPRAVIIAASPASSHPRLWLRGADLPRLRAWAISGNPIFRDGLAVVARRARADMDAGRVSADDGGGATYEQYPTESYAELFAFMSLISPDPAQRADYARRARSLLLYVMREAVRGVQPGQPFRWPAFATSDRSRWNGETFALTVDWIYPSLSIADKRLIRAVFLRWSDELVHAATTNDNHPEPIGVRNSPALLADPIRVRYSGNNYYAAHMRNLGLMALALDPGDDPEGRLRAYLADATGAWLYTFDALLRHDARGGLAPEGFEYGPQALGFAMQLLLALHTSGQDDPARLGPQVLARNTPFWAQVMPAFLSSLSPTTAAAGYQGQVYQPAWYGDGQQYLAGDYAQLFAALGIYDLQTGNRSGWDAARWIQTNIPPGGAPSLTSRVRGVSSYRDAILDFMLFDPAAAAPRDPRQGMPLTYFSAGLGHLLARTGWSATAAFFDYSLGWISIDHQTADGNSFEYYRNGEWLTKTRVGYGLPIGESDYHNTLALQNGVPAHNSADDYRHDLWLHGSQWVFGNAAGDGRIAAISSGKNYTYALGNATQLYNSASEGAVDIRYAYRSIVWLKPDLIVVFDRAASRTPGRFKRFWLQLPSMPAIVGKVATATTPRGQRLVATTLLPTNATLQGAADDNLNGEAAGGEPMRFRLMVEAPSGPSEARFLHVLQGADRAGRLATSALASCGGAMTALMVSGTLAIFPNLLTMTPTPFTCTAPGRVTSYLITGLAPHARYTVRLDAGRGRLTVALGGGSIADPGGVIAGGSLAAGAATTLASSTTPISTSSAATPRVVPTSARRTPTQPVGALPRAATATPVPAGRPGDGEITYTLARGDVYRLAAYAGAVPVDVSHALDQLSRGRDDWLNIAANGKWLVSASQRFDPACDGWACLVLIDGRLGTAAAVRAAGHLVHPSAFGAVTSDGATIVYANSGGPHVRDLYAIHRQGAAWSAPLLLSDRSRYAYNEQPSLSWDGKQVVFECGNRPYGDTGTALCLSRVDGGGFRVLLTPSSPPPGQPANGLLQQPGFAADGSILFEGDYAVEQTWRLAVGALFPTNIGRRFTNDNSPCGLPGGRIASLWLGRQGNDGQHEIKVMDARGQAYQMVLTGRDVADIGIGCGA